MKGIIFNIVEDVVTEHFDADTWDDLLDAAGVDGSYTALGNYADEDLLAIVAAAATATGQSTDDVWRFVGRAALPRLADHLGETATPAPDARAFLRSVNDIIHPEVRMLYPDAAPPVFAFEDRPDGALDVRYRSARRLDALAEGLMVGCGDLYGETIAVEFVGRDDDAGEARFTVSIGSGR